MVFFCTTEDGRWAREIIENVLRENTSGLDTRAVAGLVTAALAEAGTLYPPTGIFLREAQAVPDNHWTSRNYALLDDLLFTVSSSLIEHTDSGDADYDQVVVDLCGDFIVSLTEWLSTSSPSKMAGLWSTFDILEKVSAECSRQGSAVANEHPWAKEDLIKREGHTPRLPDHNENRGGAQ